MKPEPDPQPPPPPPQAGPAADPALAVDAAKVESSFSAARSPQRGQSTPSAPSPILCSTSNRWPQALHLYS